MSADILREKLDSGEKLLWFGSPAAGGDDKTKAPEPAVKSMYGAILKAMTVPVILATVGFIPIFGKKAVMVIPFWIVLGVLFALYLVPEDWVYGITEKRVMVGTQKSGIASFSFGMISDIHLYISKDGTGCITFTADGQQCGFYGLKEPKQVCDILAEAKDKFLE